MIELVLGGARSGKSRYALDRLESRSGALHFVATAEPRDDEMQDRITLHRQERSERWRVLEEPLYLSTAMDTFSAGDLVLIDCLTLWGSNWLAGENPSGWGAERAAFLDALSQTEADVILVSNEVGMGITPMGALSRQFVDDMGRLHQDIAALADRVVQVIAGIPLVVKEVDLPLR